MAMWGTIINVVAIILGCIAGLILPGISDRMRRCITQGLGLGIVFLGISMGLKTSNFLFVIISLVLGAVAGELLKIDIRLEQLGEWLGRTVRHIDKSGKRESKIAEGFITATLVYCVGAMAILGALDSGLRNDHNILYTKSILDGISAILFASTLGVGVIFSAVPVLLYQGAIALGATFITSLINTSDLNTIISEVTSVGGILICGIGINVLEIRKINVVNLLPSIFIVALLALANLHFGWIH